MYYNILKFHFLAHLFFELSSKNNVCSVISNIVFLIETEAWKPLSVIACGNGELIPVEYFCDGIPHCNNVTTDEQCGMNLL